MNRLDKLISKSPVKIITGITKASRYYDELAGAYFQHEPAKIVMMSCLRRNYEKFSYLAHEIQHALCYKGGCFCMGESGSQYYREYHAFKTQVITCLGYKKALKDTIKLIKSVPTDKNLDESYIHHKKACKNLMKTKLWKLALKKAK